MYTGDAVEMTSSLFCGSVITFFKQTFDARFPVIIIFVSSGSRTIMLSLLMNSRQSFYSLTFLEDFKKMGKRMLYMIHTMTDETYAVNCTLELPQKEKEDTMFLVAFFSRCYWMIGSVWKTNCDGILGC